MPFVSHDPRSGKGGKRPGAGRPTREAQQKKLQAQEIAREMLEAEIEPILAEYTRLAKGGALKRRQSAQTTRHAVERWIPVAKAFLQIDVKTGFEKLIQDLEAEERKEAEERAKDKKTGPNFEPVSKKPLE